MGDSGAEGDERGEYADSAGSAAACISVGRSPFAASSCDARVELSLLLPVRFAFNCSARAGTT